jgi:transcriptional regulator with XRE-family HTH domain
MPEIRQLRDVLAERLKRLRAVLGWEQRDLANRVRAIGLKLDRSAIAKIETNNRNVSVEELLALAAACDVEPVALLAPRDDNEEIAIAGMRLTAGGLRAWFHGLTPPAVSDLNNVGAVHTEQAHRVFHEQVSDQEWHARRRPIVEVLRNLAFAVEQSVGNDDAMRELLDIVRFEAEREIDAIDRKTRTA